MQKENVEFLETVKILAELHGIQVEYDKPPEAAKAAGAERLKIREALEWVTAHLG